jgi:sigma-B regulation protein RsbU (phosphoserine phosphatase)
MTSDALVVDVTQDWEVACDVQQRFSRNAGPTPGRTPNPDIDTLSYSGRCCQLRALGGDCYHFVPLPENRLALAVADASGKGLAAALMIANVQSSLRTAASFAPFDPAAVVDAVNRQVHSSSLDDRFATLFYGVFDEATRTLRYVNAGHNSPIVVRRDRSLTPLEPTGLPVGIFPDSTYQESAVELGRGDLVVAYTDGVVEALSPDGEEWGTRGLLSAVAKCDAERPDEIVEAIFSRLDHFSRGRQTDDATVAVVRVR